MNWKKLPKEKRNHLVLVIVVSLAVVIALGYGLVRTQYEELSAIHRRRDATESKLQQMQDAVKKRNQIAADLAKAEETLALQEEQMITGDPQSWFFTTVRRFNKPAYRINNPTFSTTLPGDVNMLAKFPYKQVTITVGGAGFYHDIGKFVADFENEFQHIRLLNFELWNLSEQVPGEKERLNFKIDLVALVKPSN
ncbi:MAG: hypothetical protein EPO07_19610, partial [Verrucomicrobia bacterium]